MNDYLESSMLESMNQVTANLINILYGRLPLTGINASDSTTDTLYQC